jgi:calcineurin-like phosphoesterase family protein
MDFATGDLHLNHRKIPIYCRRRFCLSPQELVLLDSGAPVRCKETPDGWLPSEDSLERMNTHILDEINKIVGINDTLWVLGDYCFTPKGLEEFYARKFRNRINCQNVNLIWGNHDHRNIAPVFNRTYERYIMRWKGRKIIMSHCAHAVWEGSHRKSYHLYAHSHTTAERNLDIFSIICELQPKNIQDLAAKLAAIPPAKLAELQPGRRSIDVGIDNAAIFLGEYRPFSFDEIDAILSKREGCSIDHHTEE